MKRLLCVALVFALLGFAATRVAAQNIVNASVVQFTASVDHAVLTSYVLGHFMPGAQEPMQEVDLGKPTPDGTNTITATINTRPISFGIGYTVRVKSVAGAVVGEWSAPSNAWDRRPGKPGDPVVK
jgi:hypothetical protein